MPIVDVELVTDRPGPVAPTLPRELADALGRVFDAAPGKVWVRVRELAFGAYAENGTAKPPRPVFVTVTASAPPEGERLREHVRGITEAVARVTGREPGLVHVLFEPAARGRIAFGGRLVE